MPACNICQLVTFAGDLGWRHDMGILSPGPAAAAAAAKRTTGNNNNRSYYLHVPPPPPPHPNSGTHLRLVVYFVFIWAACSCCLIAHVSAAAFLLPHLAKSGWSGFRRRHPRAVTVVTCLAACFVGGTLLPTLLVLALVPGAAHRVGKAWVAFGFALIPLLGLLAALAAVEWRRWWRRYWGSGHHPIVVVPVEPEPRAPSSQV